MKIGILLFEQMQGKNGIGSSRIRGHWLVKNWPEAEIFQQGAKYDVVIFQKAYWLDYMKNFGGIKILDLCDPDWLDATPIIGLFDLCDAITTSTEALRDEVKKMTDKPVVFIPDRQDLDFHNVQKVHEGIAKKVVWFGYSHNAKVLDKVVSFLQRKGLELTVISDARPAYPKADYNVKYDWGNPNFNFNEEILKNDIVLLPENPSPRARFKSPNKTYTAKALGMPVATTPEELILFLDENERKKVAKAGLEEVRKYWDVRTSVEEFKCLIKTLQNNK